MRLTYLTLTVVLAMILTACPNANRLPTTPPPSPPASGGSTETPPPPEPPAPEPEPEPEPQPPTPPPTLSWGTKTISNTNNTLEEGRGVSVDQQGNIFAVYNDSRYLFPDGTTAPSSGTQSSPTTIKLAKLSPSGELLWDTDISATSANLNAADITTDPSGNSIVAGKQYKVQYIPTTVEGNRTSPAYFKKVGPESSLIAKYEADGKFAWQANLTSTGDNGATGIGTDAQGNVYVTGYVCGNGQSFYGNTIQGDCDQYLAKYTSGNGTRVWVRHFGSTFNDLAGGLAVDANGNSVIVGGKLLKVLGNNEFMAGPNAPVDAYAAKFSTEGGLVWERTFSTSGGDRAYAAAFDEAGNVYVGGEASGTLNGVTSPRTQFWDGFIIKLDPSGNTVWTKQLGLEGLRPDCETGCGPAGNIEASLARITGITVANGSVFVNGNGYNRYIDASDMAWPLKIDTNGMLLAKRTAALPAANDPKQSFVINSDQRVAVGSDGVFLVAEHYLINTPASAGLRATAGGAYITKLNLNLEP